MLKMINWRLKAVIFGVSLFSAALVLSFHFCELTIAQGIGGGESGGADTPLFPPPFDMNGLMPEDGLLLGIPPILEKKNDEEEADEPKWIESSLEAFEEAAEGEYSEDHEIDVMFLGKFEANGIKIPRVEDLDPPFEFKFFVRNLDNGLVKHGVNTKAESTPPDPGIPVDAHPQAIIIFPPGEEGEPEIVRQYSLRRRC